MGLALRVLLSPARGSTPGANSAARCRAEREHVRSGESQRKDPDHIVQIRDASFDDMDVHRVATNLSGG
jgi:hypothetical protein